MHPACLPIDQLLEACSIRLTRRSGPGGQHRNKVETAVVIEHHPSGIIGQASERRTQSANRAMAIFRLRLRLAVEYALPEQPEDLDQQGELDPSSLWKQRAAGRKLAVSPEHDDFPALLAELMGALRQCDYSLPAAASRKLVSATQLVQLLKAHPPALAFVNRIRESQSLKRLK